jgi:hypothetical protein
MPLFRRLNIEGTRRGAAGDNLAQLAADPDLTAPGAGADASPPPAS